MLSCGNDRVPPSHGMWPLFCNEIGLSYDQEERVRSLQKQILSSSESWLNRHTATSSEFGIHSAHDAIIGSSELVQSRNQRVMNILTPEQRLKLLSWVAKKKDTRDTKFDHLVRELDAKLHLNKESSELEPCKDHHDAANLYIINHNLSTRNFPQTVPIIPQGSTKKLSRRPLFESLATEEEKGGKGEKRGARKMSVDSLSSLKRSSSEISCEGLEMLQEGGILKKSSSGHSLMACGHVHNITPEAAQAASSHVVSTTLAHVRSIIPLKHEPSKDQGQQAHTSQTRPEQINPQQMQCAQPNQQQYISTASSVPLQTAYPVAPAQHQTSYQNNTYTLQPSNQPRVVINVGNQQASVVTTVSDSQYQPFLQTQSFQAQTPAAPVPIVPTSMSVPNLTSQGLEPKVEVIGATNGHNYKVPSPLGLAELSQDNTLQGTQSELSFLPTSYENIVSEDGSLYNVPSHMADNSLFELTEEDWAIGEGAFLDP